MKRILFLLLALALLLSFAGCGKSENGESSPDATDETSDGKVIQTKYFGDVTEAVNGDGGRRITFKTENWTEFKAEDIDEAFLTDFDAEWDGLCNSCDYIRLELEAGSSFEVVSGAKAELYICYSFYYYAVTLPFGAYVYGTDNAYYYDSGNIPKAEGESVLFGKPNVTDESGISDDVPQTPSELKFLRLLYGLRPTEEEIGMVDLQPMLSMSRPMYPIVSIGDKRWILCNNNRLELFFSEGYDVWRFPTAEELSQGYMAD